MSNFIQHLTGKGKMALVQNLSRNGVKRILKEAKVAYRNLRKMKDLLDQIAAWKNALEQEKQLRVEHLDYLCETLRVQLRFPSYSVCESKPFVRELKKKSRNYNLTVAADESTLCLWVKLVKDGRSLLKKWDSLTPPDEILGWVAQRTL